MKFEEELLIEKLAEYQELSPGWRVIKMALEEIKIDIGWKFDTGRLLVALPDHKYKAWNNSIEKMIKNKETNDSDLDTLIGRLTHITVILPSLLHFLSRL